MKTITIILALFLVSNLNFGCGKVVQMTYLAPEKVNDGIDVGTLQQVSMDTTLIMNAVNRINHGKYNEVHSMLIYRNDKLVMEKYFKGYKYQWDARKYRGEFVDWNRNMPHSIMSCTKSYTSACIGIAIANGSIDNVHQSIFDYLPDHQHMKTGNRQYITIEHLLTMTSGLAWNEWGASHGTSANDVDMLYFNCDDPVACVLDRSWWAVPGEYFTYNGGGTVILAEILRNATNMNIEEFSMKYLFAPMSIDSPGWTQYKNGMYDSAGSLKLTPREMLKFGITYLDGGIWNDSIIIAPDWIVKSSNSYNDNQEINIPIEDSGLCGYAYSWWTSELDYNGEIIYMYRAGGWGGQSIMVFPQLDMVIVFTGGNYSSNSSLFQIVEGFILPSIL